MRRQIILVAMCSAAIALAASAPARVHTLSRAKRTVWDSVYTDTQAARGDSVYKETCSKCHGATLAGTDDGSPLTGANFLANWNGLSVGELYEKIRTSMPPDKPKSIARPQLADVVSYLLAQNKFPSGSKALSDSAEALKDIKILQSKP